MATNNAPHGPFVHGMHCLDIGTYDSSLAAVGFVVGAGMRIRLLRSLCSRVTRPMIAALAYMIFYYCDAILVASEIKRNNQLNILSYVCTAL